MFWHDAALLKFLNSADVSELHFKHQYFIHRGNTEACPHWHLSAGAATQTCTKKLKSVFVK